MWMRLWFFNAILWNCSHGVTTIHIFCMNHTSQSHRMGMEPIHVQHHTHKCDCNNHSRIIWTVSLTSTQPIFFYLSRIHKNAPCERTFTKMASLTSNADESLDVVSTVRRFCRDIATTIYFWINGVAAKMGTTPILCIAQWKRPLKNCSHSTTATMTKNPNAAYWLPKINRNCNSIVWTPLNNTIVMNVEMAEELRPLLKLVYSVHSEGLKILGKLLIKIFLRKPTTC